MRRLDPGLALLLLAVATGCAGTRPAALDAGPTAPEAVFAVELPGFTVLSRDTIDGIGQLEVAHPSGELTVRAFVFLPPGAGAHPAVLFNHGGVSGVSGDMKRRGRDLAREGYVVAAPAYRGEGGSDGRIEVAAGEVDDVLAAARLLAASPRVDGERMAVTGSSHGALISVLAAAREPERFRCVVSACGVMDVVSWYRYLVDNDFDVSDSLSVAVYGTGPEDKPEAFRARQAIRVADRIAVPVLLQQGQADRTVPPEQARLMARTLADLGRVEVELREYPQLGHAFWFWEIAYHSEDEMVEADAAWRDFLAFLERHL